MVKKIVRGISKIPYFFIKKRKRNPRTLYLKEVAKGISDSDFDIGFRIIPKDLCRIDIIDREETGISLAIVLQGPICYQDNFTVETVKYYRKQYPNVPVIISTWNSEKEDVLGLLEEIGAIVIRNELPAHSGHGNINYQIVSSRAGINKAREMGVRYVCKSRTDQRLGKTFVFEFLINLLNCFPIDKGVQGQNDRVILLSMVYGNMFIPYLLSDFFYFGAVEDIEKIFDISLDEREPFSAQEGWNRIDYVNNMEPAEIYLLQGYLKNIGENANCSIEDYWMVLKKRFICVDRKLIDLQWPKYDIHYCLNEYYGDYFWDDDNDKIKTMNFDFINWMNLYSGSLIYSVEYEDYLNKPFR